MEAQIARLAATVEAGFRRVEDLRDEQRERHEENTERLEEVKHDLSEVKAEVRKTNGRVNVHDVEIARHSEQLRSLAGGKDAPSGRITQQRIKDFIYGGTALIALWKLIGYAVSVLEKHP